MGQKMLNSEVEYLMWAQEQLDFYVELGATLEELYGMINGRIERLKSHITPDVDPIETVQKTLPELNKWHLALSQLNTFRTLEGQQEPGFIDKDWLVMQWGLYLDYHSGEYEDRKLEEAIPFLQHMEHKYGVIERNDLEDWAEYVFEDEMESVLMAYYDNQTPADDLDLDELKNMYLEGAADIGLLARHLRAGARDEDYTLVEETMVKLKDIVDKLHMRIMPIDDELDFDTEE